MHIANLHHPDLSQCLVSVPHCCHGNHLLLSPPPLSDQTEVDCSPGTENSEQHNLLEQLQSRYRQMEERITCPICIDNHIKLVFQCGHASCIDCSAALKTCPICRQTIRERIQLFV